jgi:Fe-S oxidoreductase
MSVNTGENADRKADTPGIPVADVIGMLSDNLRLRGSVVPLPQRIVTGWTTGLDLPRGGRRVLYTGQMFQLMPYLEKLATVRERIAGSPLIHLSALGRRVNRFVNVARFLGEPSPEVRRRYDQMLIDVVAVLRRAGVDHGSLFEDDLYTGALVHDFGEDEVVALQGRRIRAIMRTHGVEEVITVDPHTTHMMRTVLPELVDGFDVRVRHYLEVLADIAPPVRNRLDETVTVHDSCLFARGENVIDEPRVLLRDAGVNVCEVDRSGTFTWCCGGPAESLYPEKAHANAEVRVDQLSSVAPEAVTMCPICLVNLRNAAGGALGVHDISDYLRRAYDEPAPTDE